MLKTGLVTGLARLTCVGTQLVFVAEALRLPKPCVILTVARCIPESGAPRHVSKIAVLASGGAAIHARVFSFKPCVLLLLSLAFFKFGASLS